MAEHGTAVDPRIPVLVMIDAEPDGFFIRRTDAAPWAGFERAVEVMTDARVMLARRTGRDPHFTWRVRADPQVAETYGSAAWAFERHRAAFEALRAAGDEVGVHVHAYRWDARADGWVEDFGSQDWVERCVRAGVDAFTHHFGRPPTSFSMGMDWMNQATMRLVAELGLRHELSIVAGRETQPFPPRDR